MAKNALKIITVPFINFPDSPIQGIVRPNFANAAGLPGKIITAFLPYVLAIAGFITVIIIVISGIQFITSGGNPKGAEAAKGRLTYALIGFILILLSFAILQIINYLFLGSEVI